MAIEGASEYYGVNKSDAIARACNDVPELVASVRAVLQRDDLTPQQKREMAETVSTSAVEFDLETAVHVEKDP
jgi:hypothetical protein